MLCNIHTKPGLFDKKNESLLFKTFGNVRWRPRQESNLRRSA